MKYIRSLYDWVLSWAYKKTGKYGLALISFTESIFFPIPPDILLIPFCIGNPKKIFKFASIKHILNSYKNDQNKIFELFEEISRDLKNYDLELRIEELESKFSKDLSESTFNEIRELKKQKNIN